MNRYLFRSKEDMEAASNIPNQTIFDSLVYLVSHFPLLASTFMGMTNSHHRPFCLSCTKVRGRDHWNRAPQPLERQRKSKGQVDQLLLFMEKIAMESFGIFFPSWQTRFLVGHFDNKWETHRWAVAICTLQGLISRHDILVRSKSHSIV